MSLQAPQGTAYITGNLVEAGLELIKNLGGYNSLYSFGHNLYLKIWVDLHVAGQRSRSSLQVQQSLPAPCKKGHFAGNTSAPQ